MSTRASTVGPFDKAVSAALRAAAAELQITQTEVTRRTGIPHRALIRYWNGESPIPVGKLVDIASALGLQASHIIEAAEVIARRAQQNSRG